MFFLGLSLAPIPFFVYASSEDSDKTAHLYRLGWVWAAPIAICKISRTDLFVYPICEGFFVNL